MLFLRLVGGQQGAHPPPLCPQARQCGSMLSPRGALLGIPRERKQQKLDVQEVSRYSALIMMRSALQTEVINN